MKTVGLSVKHLGFRKRQTASSSSCLPLPPVVSIHIWAERMCCNAPLWVGTLEHRDTQKVHIGTTSWGQVAATVLLPADRGST